MFYKNIQFSFYLEMKVLFVPFVELCCPVLAIHSADIWLALICINGG